MRCCASLSSVSSLCLAGADLAGMVCWYTVSKRKLAFIMMLAML